MRFPLLSIVVAVLLVSIGHSQTTQKVGHQVTAKVEDSGKATSDAANKQGSPVQSALLLAQQKPSLATDENSNVDQEKEDQETSKWSDPITWFTGALVAVGLWQGIVFRKQWKSMEAALKATEHANEVSRTIAETARISADASLAAMRPWVSCRAELNGPLTHTAGGDAVFRFRITLKNIGHLPAQAVCLIPFINLLGDENSHSIVRLREAATKCADNPEQIEGLLLFPGEEYEVGVELPVWRWEIDKACYVVEPARMYMPELCLVVNYTYPLAEKRASTCILYRIEKIDGHFEPDKLVPIGGMKLSKYVLWSGFAT
ncbi:MAG: hypothetical protein WAU88_13295 [Candidatus Zixiibacteriota bacterium]